MAYLRLMLSVTGHARQLLPKLSEALRESGTRQVLDLCSGGGGPWQTLAPALAAQGAVDRIELCDLFPDLDAFAVVEQAAPEVVRGSQQPVDATRVERTDRALRTLFNAFHHFPPEQAKKILQDAVDARAPIAIFEVVSREPLSLLSLLGSPLAAFLTTPFLRPFRPAFLFFTYVVPLFPLLVGFDGVVSALRIYNAEECQELVATLRDPGYRWDIGRIRLGLPPVHGTYLIGYPP